MSYCYYYMFFLCKKTKKKKKIIENTCAINLILVVSLHRNSFLFKHCKLWHAYSFSSYSEDFLAQDG